MEAAKRDIAGLVSKYREIDRSASWAKESHSKLKEDLHTLRNAEKSYVLANSALRGRHERLHSDTLHYKTKAERERESGRLLENDVQRVQRLMDEELEEYGRLKEERARLHENLVKESEELNRLTESYNELFTTFQKSEDFLKKLAVARRHSSQLHDKVESRKKKNQLLLLNIKRTIDEGQKILLS